MEAVTSVKGKTKPQGRRETRRDAEKKKSYPDGAKWQEMGAKDKNIFALSFA
jgi:hypothetical protein